MPHSCLLENSGYVSMFSDQEKCTALGMVLHSKCRNTLILFTIKIRVNTTLSDFPNLYTCSIILSQFSWLA